MSRDLATRAPSGLFRRLSNLLGFDAVDKQSLSRCADRMTALDDPATRRALADLPPELLLDIGVRDLSHHLPMPELPDGDALRRHMW